MNKKPIKIVYSKLGVQKAHGMAWPDKRKIVIDIRLTGHEKLETIIHEVLHCQNPKWPEIMVAGKAKEIADILWGQDYRQADL